MPRGVAKEPGVKKLPNVPYRAGDMAPNMRDADPSRGVFANLPKDAIQRVMDLGAPTTGPAGSRTTTSPASATFTPGKPNARESEKETKGFPESQIVGSLKAQG